MNPSNKTKSIPELQKSSPLDKNDDLLEIIPEAYLEQRNLSKEEILNGIDDLVRETAAFIIRSKNENQFRNEN